MKRRDFISKSATGLVAGAALATPALAQSSPKVTWRLQSSYPRSLTTIFGGAETLSKYVSDLTDGNFELKVFAGGEIVPGLQTIDAVMNNTVEMGHTISAYKMGADPTWALGTGLPFGLNARQQNSWFYHGGGNELLSPFYEKNGLVAFPFFTFMGLLLQRSGLAEDLLETIGQLFGSVRGGLAYAVIFVGALLAATTGIVAASVISMGLISLPIMQRYGYGQRTATGVIIASGTLAQVIPPSLVLIVMADQLGVSVGQMYRAALGPGLLLIGMFVLYIFIVSITRPKEVPALPLEARGPRGGETSLLVVLVVSVLVGNLTGWLLPMENASVGLVLNCSVGAGFAILAALVNRHTGISLLSDLAERVILVLVPPLGLIFLVLGTILVGIATPTEGGALGSVGTILLAWFAGRLNWQGFRAAVMSTAELATFVMFILVGARVFSLTFYGVDGHIWVEELLLGIPGGVFGFMVFVSILVFVLGFVLDFYEIAFILLPLLIIPAQSLGIDLVWFGVILAINLQTSFMSPPFGFSLFFLRSVVPTDPYVDEISGETIPGVKTTTIYRGVLPFIGIHILLMILVASFPQTVRLFDREVIELDSTEVESELNNIPGFGGMELAPLSFD